MADIERAKAALIARILDGESAVSREQRRSAFDGATVAVALGALLEKVARAAHRITDDDVAAARRAGQSEDQLFELVVCAAVGEANRRYEAAHAALDAASAKE